jgi:hypothetical protein
VLRPLVDEVRAFEGFGPCLLASDTEPHAVELVRSADARATRRLIRQVYTGDGRNGSRQTPEDLDMLQLIAAWFQHHPEQLARTLRPEDAARICRLRACR